MPSRAEIERNEVAASNLMPLLSTSGLILLSGLLISVYSVMLRQAALRMGSQDCLKQAAMFVAEDMRKQTASDPAFGHVGICDADIGENDSRVHVTSFNRLYATLRLDDIVAKRLDVPVMSRMVESDYDTLKKMELQLCAKLNQRAKSTFPKARELAAAGRGRNEQLVELKVELGSLKTKEFDSGMPLSDEKNFGTGANYPAGQEVAIAGAKTARFCALAKETRFVENVQFAPAAKGVVPSAVLVVGTFKSTDERHRNDPPHSRSAIVLLGGADSSAPDSVLMVGFPQGMPKSFHSLRALSSAHSNVAGAWRQAVDGYVPGDGRLVPVSFGIDSQDMSPQEAVQVSFYQWVRSLGPKLSDIAIDKIFNLSWATITPRPLETAEQKPFIGGPNSALTKDTGARARAFLFQAGPGGAGQSVLKGAFEGQFNPSLLPNSAVPLDIDEYGNCNLPGHTGFDRALTSDLLKAVYDTNLVANESLAIAKSIITRMERAEDQANKNIDLSNEELGSLSGRRARLERPGKASAELELLRKSEEELTNAINVQRAKAIEYGQVKARANAVLSSAEGAAQASFDICANMSKYAENGIFRCENGRSFMLGSVYIFRPLTHSVTEDEIYKGSSETPWTGTINVLEPAPERLAIEGRLTLQDSASSESTRALPRFVVLESRQLTTSNPQVLVLERSPFADSGIPVGQFSYYVEDGLVTGQDPQVGWSVLVRDAAASLGFGRDTIASRQTKWCTGEGRGAVAVSSCPGLSVEIQVRSPVPLIPDLPVGSFVVSPSNHERVSQIPPMPANML